MIRCDFCSGAPVTWRYPTRTFKLTSIRFRSVSDWAACDVCHALIEAGDREGLLTRTMATGQLPPGVTAAQLAEAKQTVRHGQALFFEMREGPPTRVREP